MKEKHVLPKAVEQLVLDIAEYIDDSRDGRKKKIAQENPAAWLVSMLERIKKDLPVVSATLHFTVARTSYDEYLKEAREKLSQSEAKAHS